MNTKIDFEKIRQQQIPRYGTPEETEAYIPDDEFYKNRGHFIYELLQNAEDEKATKVCFKLFDDRLEFHHNGNLFNKKDVVDICRIGKGTKRKDFNKNGKFGLGFKSIDIV